MGRYTIRPNAVLGKINVKLKISIEKERITTQYATCEK
jgi:hypothetical protein